MAAPLLMDFDKVASAPATHDRKAIYAILPHRYEFELLDGVCHLDSERKSIAVFCDVGERDWWVKAHFPEKALLPGVLMLEMAAHAAALMVNLFEHNSALIVFGGVDKCKFRASVVPGSRFYVFGRAIELRSRRVIAEMQGVVDGRLVFEAQVNGLVT